MTSDRPLDPKQTVGLRGVNKVHIEPSKEHEGLVTTVDLVSVPGHARVTVGRVVSPAQIAHGLVRQARVTPFLAPQAPSLSPRGI